MAQLYALSRSGGPASARFTSYLGRVEHEWGLVAYNPMAGPQALDAVERLLALDAELVAANAASEIAVRCEYSKPLTLAVVVASPGMWTDRLATEVQHRTVARRRPQHGLVYQWVADVFDVESVARESAAEAVRVMWTAMHGPATTVLDVMDREGLAYALSSSPYGEADAGEDGVVEDALAVIGDSTSISDIVGVLYGDPACEAHGWPAPGVAEYAGYRYAIARAARHVATAGAGPSLRSGRQ
jgi:hypothetical protein